MRRQAKPPPSFPALVHAFFVEHLTQQRALSPRTVAAYRDAFMLFLGFAEARLGRSPAQLTLPDITPDLIMAFLDHLERDRHNSVRSRNARLAALRSFLKFAAHRDVSSLQVIEHALGVPSKRFERPMLGYLSREEMLAVIGAPDGTWFSQRDHVLLLMLYNTGARVSEIVGVKSAMSYSTMPPLVFICMARGASSAACRCGAQPSGRSGLGFGEIRRSIRTRRCCPIAMAKRCRDGP